MKHIHEREDRKEAESDKYGEESLSEAAGSDERYLGK
jgi:hypothetical protein